MTALSIHFGLNRVDPAHYNGWDGQLRACEQDAQDMRAIASENGYASTIILTRDATANRLLQELAKASIALKFGDTLLVTYSGHGGQIPDRNHDEGDGQDETWVLYDRMVTDDELWEAWSRFAPGVRILVISDSCNSGTVTRALVPTFVVSEHSGKAMGDIGNRAPRRIPFEVEMATYLGNQSLYDFVQSAVPKESDLPVRASVLLISGCQDDQLSYDGPVNGAFTAQLLKVWNKGAFVGNHRDLHRQIVDGMSADQTPNFFPVGAPNSEFEAETPFKPAGSRSVGNGVIEPGSCCFVLDVTGGLSSNATEEQVRELLAKQGCEVLTQAFVNSQLLKTEIFAKAQAIPRDGSASLSCSADSHGEVHCTGSVTIRF